MNGRAALPWSNAVAGAIAAVLLLPACGGGSDAEPRPLASAEVSEVAPSPTLSNTYTVSDARVTKRGEDGSLHWVITVDATWGGGSDLVEAKCLWRTFDSSGTENFRAARSIEGPGEDIEIGDVYPDEIAGVPVEVKVSCSTAPD